MALPVDVEPIKINREFNGVIIKQRANGYIDATAMCKAHGKRLDNYLRLDTTNKYIQALANYLRCEVVNLITRKEGRGGYHASKFIGE